MKLGNILNNDRVNAMASDVNAYIKPINNPPKASAQQMSKVVFPEPYENAKQYYNKTEFKPPQPPDEPKPINNQNNFKHMLDIKSLLPMLMSGKLDMLKPLMNVFSSGNAGGGLGDITKIFELFKPKSKTKKTEKEEDISSKFDDMIIIED